MSKINQFLKLYIMLACFSLYGMEQGKNPVVISSKTPLLVYNITNLNIIIDYEIQQGDRIKKVIAPQELGYLGSFLDIKEARFTLFNNHIAAQTREFEIKLGRIYECKNINASTHDEKVVYCLIGQQDNTIKVSLGFKILSSLLKPVMVPQSSPFTHHFRGLVSRKDITSALNPITPEQDAFHRYLLGVRSDATAKDLQYAYNGLINLWTHKQVMLVEKFYSELNTEVYRSANTKLNSFSEAERALRPHELNAIRLVEFNYDYYNQINFIINQINKSYTKLLNKLQQNNQSEQ